jgi:hypothetical protein
MTDHPDDYFGDHVHQATAVIAAQVNSTMGEALDRLRIRAAAMDQSLEHTALDVLDGLIRFGPL